MAEARVSPFGEQLRRLREAVGITQEELAERAGLSREAISALERGLRRYPHPQTVRALSDGLGLSDKEAATFRASVPKRPPELPPPNEVPSSPLPVPLTGLVGRQQELEHLQLQLTAGHARLVTLTGPGGVGKTRLALELTADLAPAFADGVVFVPLATVLDPALVLPTIAEALGVRDTNGSSLAERSARVLRDKRLLLVLDNFEHVTEAASMVTKLLATCPGLAVLVTSQSKLRLSGEHEYPVPPLAVPLQYQPIVLAELSANDAVALFLQRARAAKPDFTLTEANAAAVAEICRRLDGLPLAIELAAARVKVFASEMLLARLDRQLPLLAGGPQDQPARLRSMRDAVGWSYGLLHPEEQALFRHLAVFSGGFTLEAAQAVTEGAAIHSSALDGVVSLLDKSLLRRLDAEGDEPRFGMLTSLQEYGQERLAIDGEDAAANRAHAAYFIELAEQAWPAFRRRAGQEPWLNRLEPERGNLRSALAWLEKTGDVRSLVQLTGSLFWFWYVRGPLSEGRFWLERALEEHTGVVPPEARARALVGAGLLAHFQGDDERARTWLNASLAMSTELDDPWWIALPMLFLGMVEEDHGEYLLAEARFAEALALFQTADDQENTALTLNHLGIVAWGRGDLERAAALCGEAVALQRKTGDAWGMANSLGYLGLLAGERGDFARAATVHSESMALRWQAGAWEEVAGSLADLAALAAAVDRMEQAAWFFGAAKAWREELGREPKLPERAVFERAEVRARTALGADAFAKAKEHGRKLPREQAVFNAVAFAEVIADQHAGQ
jgi:predicted ATPase/DNA-binding XRE family transcriptional regulator